MADALFGEHGLDALDWRALYRAALSDGQLRTPPHGRFFGAEIRAPAAASYLVPPEARNAHSSCEWVAAVAPHAVHLVSTRRARYECSVPSGALRSMRAGRRADDCEPGADVEMRAALALGGTLLMAARGAVATLRCDVADRLSGAPCAPMVLAVARADDGDAGGAALLAALADVAADDARLVLTPDGRAAAMVSLRGVVAFETAPLHLLSCLGAAEFAVETLEAPPLLMRTSGPSARLVLAVLGGVGGGTLTLRDVSSDAALRAPFSASSNGACVATFVLGCSPGLVLLNCCADNLLCVSDNSHAVLLIDAHEGVQVADVRATTFDHSSAAFDPVSRDLVTSNWMSRVLLHRDSARRAAVFGENRPTVAELEARYAFEQSRHAVNVFSESDTEEPTRRYVREFHYVGHTGHIGGIAMSAHMLVSVGDTTLRIWDRASPVALHVLRVEDLASPSLVTSPAPSVRRTPLPRGEGAAFAASTSIPQDAAWMFVRPELGLIFASDGSRLLVVSTAPLR